MHEKALRRLQHKYNAAVNKSFKLGLSRLEREQLLNDINDMRVKLGINQDEA